jgi:GT2 family glycosyltransferase
MLSIIIVNFNTRVLLRRCLESVERNLTNVEHEVCVVDNGSRDGSVDDLTSRFPRVVVDRRSENVGFARGVNAGLALTRGDLVMWLNPDAEILNGGVENLIRFFTENRAAGVVGPRILSPDGSVQLSCRSWPSYGTALFNRYSLLTRFFPNNPHSRGYLASDWDHTSTREVDWVSGCCLLHRRQVAAEIGGLDEAFFMYCEDVDFCRRARCAGWAVVYNPDDSREASEHVAVLSQAPRRRRDRAFCSRDGDRRSSRVQAPHDGLLSPGAALNARISATKGLAVVTSRW